MDMIYSVDLSVRLSPIWHDEPPRVRVACHNQTHEIDLYKTCTIDFQFKSTGTQNLMIAFTNKKDSDTLLAQGLDKEVIIEEIAFFGITDPRFLWSARYRPSYPASWYNQQVQAGHPPAAELRNIDRLSWNGEWVLEFELPVFTWIHEMQNLGWIYR